jgi:sugar phosphate isomerase/epimerase
VKLAFSTNAFKRFSLEESIKQIGGIGYKGVEILCDIPHLYPPFFAQDNISRLRRCLEQEHLEISNLNAFTLYAINDVYHPSWIEDDTKATEIRIRHTLECLKAAKLLGAKNISTQGGGPQPLDRLNNQELMSIFRKNLGKVVEIAEHENIRILVEPEPGLIIENASQITEFLRNFDTESVGLNCDLGHFYCVGEDPAKIVYQLQDYIGHFHLADIASNRKHNHLLPGTGSINFESIFDAMRGIGYRGYVTVELYTYQDEPLIAATKAYNYLLKFL